jgi:copper resistance protein B
MNRLALLVLAPLALATPAVAQPMDHAKMPGMKMPAPAPAGPHAGHAMPEPAPEPDPHAGHAMPPGAAPMDHAGMPGMTTPGQPLLSELDVPKTPPPPAPGDHAADRVFPPAAMAAARDQLRREHGAMPLSKVMVSLAEHQARNGADGYRWEGQAWFGGDIDRFVLKTEGEGTRGHGVESAEVQALYSRAVGVYTDVQAGVRQDFEPRGRTYATIGFETLLPYWFDVEGAAFLSTRGELLGRLEGSYDLRLTNRLILQPRAELNFAAQDTRATRTGSGLSNAELGLRLRYEIRREFAPYIGVSWDRKVGKTADYVRARGEGVVDRSVVFGVRAFF